LVCPGNFYILFDLATIADSEVNLSIIIIIIIIIFFKYPIYNIIIIIIMYAVHEVHTQKHDSMKKKSIVWSHHSTMFNSRTDIMTKPKVCLVPLPTLVVVHCIISTRE